MLTILIFTVLFGLSGATPPPIDPPMYGVNIGGWFILERFLNPSLFALANKNGEKAWCEWSYCLSSQDTPTNLQALRDHWDTWLSEPEVALLGKIGFTHVRIPIGYWAMMTEKELEDCNEPFLTGQWTYMVRAIGWFKKYDIKVLIDLHGAPGSQNGWDNSGHQIGGSGPVGWGTGDTMNRTLIYVDRLAKQIADLELDEATSGAVFGLELLNEAFPARLVSGVSMVQQYYTSAYPIARKYLPASKYAIVIEGAFSTPTWIGFMSGSEYENVYLDLHIYHCFDDGMRRTPYDGQLSVTCNVDINQITEQTLPTFVGEWSAAWKVESDYADTEPFPTQDQQEFMRKFVLSQMKVYGSYYWWNFKTESAPMWDYFLGASNGWLPSVLPAQEVSDACTGTFPTDYPSFRLPNSTLPNLYTSAITFSSAMPTSAPPTTAALSPVITNESRVVVFSEEQQSQVLPTPHQETAERIACATVFYPFIPMLVLLLQ